MVKDLISVIVPVYNTGKTLMNCVDSVLNQTYSCIEIILVDDGSNDGVTAKLCEQLASVNEKIRCYHKTNGGAASARNYGIARANGEFIAFVDSDDYIDREMYESLMNDAQKHGVFLVLSDICVENQRNRLNKYQITSSGIYTKKDILHSFLLGNWHSACTNLYHHSLFENNMFPENEVNEDYMLNFQILLEIQQAVVNTNCFYHYIKRAGSVTNSKVTEKQLTWLKHTSFVKKGLCVDHPELKMEQEAVFQYVFSNVVLGNRCLLDTSGKMDCEVKKIYETCSKNLRTEKGIVRNKYLTVMYRIMGLALAYIPKCYKVAVFWVSKIRR